MYGPRTIVVEISMTLSGSNAAVNEYVLYILFSTVDLPTQF